MDGSAGDDEVDAVHRRLRSGAGGGAGGGVGGGGERRGSAERLRKKADQVRLKSKNCVNTKCSCSSRYKERKRSRTGEAIMKCNKKIKIFIALHNGFTSA